MAHNTISVREFRLSCFDRVFMVLKAYFDESGKYNDPIETAAVVGGFIATVDEWEELDPLWRKVLDEYGVNEFHASDLAHWRGEYASWGKNEEKRRSFYKKLSNIILNVLKRPSKPLGALLPLDQFKQLSIEKQNEWGNDPYFVCLQDSIQLAAVHMQDLYGIDERLEILCDETKGFEGIAKKVYHACKEHLPNNMGRQLVAFGHGQSCDVPALQVADWIAYECLQMRRKLLTERDWEIIDKPRWSFSILDRYHYDFEFYKAMRLWERTPFSHYTS